VKIIADIDSKTAEVLVDGELKASYPGLGRACGAYKMTETQLLAMLAQNNPIERLEPLAKNKIPILHIHGDNDIMVTLEKKLRGTGEALSGARRSVQVNHYSGQRSRGVS
jgi:fermentation-respiration switch protein FrsA (DUF1100 family)